MEETKNKLKTQKRSTQKEAKNKKILIFLLIYFFNISFGFYNVLWVQLGLPMGRHLLWCHQVGYLNIVVEWSHGKMSKKPLRNSLRCIQCGK